MWSHNHEGIYMNIVSKEHQWLKMDPIPNCCFFNPCHAKWINPCPAEPRYTYPALANSVDPGQLASKESCQLRPILHMTQAKTCQNRLPVPTLPILYERNKWKHMYMYQDCPL